MPDYRRTPHILGSLWSAVHRTLRVALLEKALFDLAVDTMEPLFGRIASFPTGGELCLQLGYPIFSGSQLIRKLLRHVERMAAIFVGDAGRP